MSGKRTRYIEIDDELYVEEDGMLRKLSLIECQDRLGKYTQHATAHAAEPGEDLLHVERQKTRMLLIVDEAAKQGFNKGIRHAMIWGFAGIAVGQLILFFILHGWRNWQ